MSKYLAAIVAIAALTFVRPSPGQSVPPLINYQGRLTDQTGAPLTAGAYGLQFRLWDSPTAASASDLIWGQQQNVTVQSNGVFNVILGSPGGSPISGATPAVNNLLYAFTESNCFLGVTVTISNGVTISSPSEILPRQQLLAVPYAVSALQAQQATVSSSLVSNLANALCPPGTIVAFGGATVPSGWLLCDGSLVNRSVYSNLFTAIATAWGGGDGSTTFNLPDTRGLFLRGVDNSPTKGISGRDPDSASRTAENPGGNAGNAVGSYQLDDYLKHSHSGYVVGNGVTGQSGVGSYLTVYGSTTVSPTTGGNETRPKNVYVNYIIKY